MNHKRLCFTALDASFRHWMDEIEEKIRVSNETGRSTFISFELLLLAQLEDGLRADAQKHALALSRIEDIVRPRKDLVFPQLYAKQTDAEKLQAIQDVLEDFQ